ncbi:hypothetical protein BKA58DRAFT_473146 [Alternaria rosae]|uniref:uncharacterized protein n=1 Tax=Alternaria rosae TaxID=1187941 RepID=UPI001E8CC270|nr:uncharacterized protein BKA58DRAFT_473146 [Alternaria rosae]KAH6859044.1 hypothetical protein BKA58DRAFT_473146 [Alternaria rosae]
MSSTNSTVVEQVDKDIELARLVKKDSELPQPATDPTPPSLQVVSTDSTLPTPLPPLGAYTLPSAIDHDLEANNNDSININNQTPTSRTRATLPTRLTEQVWFLHVERHAPFIGLVVGNAAFGATCVGIVVAITVAVAK